MKKLKNLGIATVVILMFSIIGVAAFAAFGNFEGAPDNGESADITVGPSAEEQTEGTFGNITATIKTDLGDIVIKLGDCSAAEKFIAISDSGAFGSAEFLTVAENIFIQTNICGEGFDFEENDFYCNEGAVGFVIEGEKAFPSVVIITAENLSDDYGESVLVFGKVVSGTETVKAIASSENSGYPGGYSAAEPVKINGIEVMYPDK